MIKYSSLFSVAKELSYFSTTAKKMSLHASYKKKALSNKFIKNEICTFPPI